MSTSNVIRVIDLFVYAAKGVAGHSNLRIVSIHRTSHLNVARSSKLGISFAAAFALLAGLNCAVQLTVVRSDILAHETNGIEWLVFQNPSSVMLRLDLVGWFFLGLAFLSVVSSDAGSRLAKSIRCLLVSNGVVGLALMVGPILPLFWYWPNPSYHDEHSPYVCRHPAPGPLHENVVVAPMIQPTRSKCRAPSMPKYVQSSPRVRRSNLSDRLAAQSIGLTRALPELETAGLDNIKWISVGVRKSDVVESFLGGLPHRGS